MFNGYLNNMLKEWNYEKKQTVIFPRLQNPSVGCESMSWFGERRAFIWAVKIGKDFYSAVLFLTDCFKFHH